MAVNQIRWKKDDYNRLRKAVNNFNSKINRLEQMEEDTSYLPQEYNYKELKKKITTRKELNRIINSLKSFTSERGKPDIGILPSGQKLTKWEMHEMKLERNRALKDLYPRLGKEVSQRSINMEQFASINEQKLLGQIRMLEGTRQTKELKKLYKELGKESLKRVQPFTTQSEDELRAQIKNVKNIGVDVNQKLKEGLKRLRNIGTTDIEMRRAIQYQENYLKAVKSFKNFEGYERLKFVIKSIRNPLKFFDFVVDLQNPNLINIYDIYQYGKMQSEFNKLLEDFGINTSVESFKDFKSDVIEKLKQNGYI